MEKITRNGEVVEVTRMVRVGDYIHLDVGCEKVVLPIALAERMIDCSPSDPYREPTPGTVSWISPRYEIHGINPLSVRLEPRKMAGGRLGFVFKHQDGTHGRYWVRETRYLGILDGGFTLDSEIGQGGRWVAQ